MICETCGTIGSEVLKWNNGNPMIIELPNCDCEADKVTEEWEKRVRARKEREEKYPLSNTTGKPRVIPSYTGQVLENLRRRAEGTLRG